MIGTQCFNCKKYLGAHECEAFPLGIPEKIFTGEFDHTEVFPGQDNDIVFTPFKKSEK